MSQQSENSKFAAVVREMGWDEETAQEFHHFLGRQFYGMKDDDMSFRELLDLAEQFEGNYEG